MDAGKLVSAVFGTILRVLCTVLVIFLIYRGSLICYDYGYRIFTEPAVSSGEGRMVTVTVTQDMGAVEIGELFASKGLTKDARLLALQYLFSEFREDLKPGTYELSTAMTAEEMFEVMATVTEETQEAQE